MRRANLPNARNGPVYGTPGPIWPPTRIAGCVAWYDMLETYTESGGNVTAIRNMVSGSDDMAEATNPPALDLAGLNGRPCMVPNGTSSLLISTEAAVVAPFIGTQTEFTITTVFRIRTHVIGPGTTLFGAASSAVATNRSFVFGRETASTQFVVRRRADNGANTAGFIPTGVVSYPRVVTAIIRSNTFAFVVNGRSLTPNVADLSPTGALTPDRVGFFCRPSSTPSLFEDSPTGAAIIHAGALDIGSVRGLHTALMGRWGISAP